MGPRAGLEFLGEDEIICVHAWILAADHPVRSLVAIPTTPPRLSNVDDDDDVDGDNNNINNMYLEHHTEHGKYCNLKFES